MKRKRYKKSGLVGLYTRKLWFFVIVFSVSIFGYYIYKNGQIGADETYHTTYSYSNKQVINIVLSEKGKATIDGKDSNLKTKTVDGYDVFEGEILKEPEYDISQLTINLKLPKPVSTKVEHKVILQHNGISDYYSEITDSSTIRYVINDISTSASVSIYAKIPSGVITKTIFDKAVETISNAEFSFWVYLAFILPTITFAAMIIFIKFTLRINKVDMPDKAVSSPPMAIPAALVGVLYHQRVTPREIAATLIDLALRKDIFILDRERGFAFGKGKFDQRLLGYEKALLSKIFKSNMSTSQELLQQKVQNQIYSKRVSLVSAGIYAIATRLGYFRENPRIVHAKYWLVGSLSLAAGIVGFFFSFITKVLPSFTAFFWVGMMLSALVIIIMSAYIPLRTVMGNDALSNWLSFRKYLSDPSPIEYSPTVHQLFEAYLPYAIVLDCEAAWARRFTQHNFLVPDWFITDKNGLGINDFCLALFPIVSYVGRTLSALREPGFE